MKLKSFDELLDSIVAEHIPNMRSRYSDIRNCESDACLESRRNEFKENLIRECVRFLCERMEK